ncbi:hypothetical protein [Anaeromicropila herbilytica]|uniref:Uncharacterized protein n=1 Tax=Anaeromicropila herbilytica TaxID=2785025 RepID=A0A7R7IEH2_9FIRM|nr:hypothetical protein [Anaeromicropila herbilytica]BCN32104.1 hypothetical protein bsdtb5_33990 [Anaeromicropila herbilytica]
MGNDHCFTYPEPYHIGRRGLRGPQGIPGTTSTNDNAIFFYRNADLDNIQTLPVRSPISVFLFNNSNINGKAITQTVTDNVITLAAGVYFIDFSTYAIIPTLASAEVLSINTAILDNGIPLNPTTEPIQIYSPISQYIQESIIIETAGTPLTVAARVTSSLTTGATANVTFVNTILNIIRLGDVTV